MLWHAKVLLPTVLSVLLLVVSLPPFSNAARGGTQQEDRGDHPRQPTQGGYALEKIEIFSPGDMEILEGVGMLFGLSGGDISSIISLVKMGLGVVDFIDKVFSKVFNGSSIALSLPSSSDRDMLAMFEVLSHRLDQMHIGVQGVESSLRDMARGLPHMLRWEVLLDSLEDYTRPISSLYQRFQLYQQNRDEVEEHTMLDFAESVVSHDTTSIMNLMANVHSMVAPDAPPLRVPQQMQGVEPEYVTVDSRVNLQYQQHYKETLVRMQDSNMINRDDSKNEIAKLSLRPSVFDMLGEVIKEYNKCDMKQSPQQMLMGLYSLVAITQARGYAMVNYAYMLLKLRGKGNFTVEQELSRTFYEQYSRNTIQRALRVVAEAANTYRRCDPKKHVQGDTYVMLTELLQGHIENEADMSSRGSCMNSCSSYEHSRVQGCFSPDSQVCGYSKKCKGTLHSCKFYHADADVCFSDNPYRRYDWLHYEDGTTLGHKGGCSNKKKVDSWWRFMIHCSNCMCLCDDPSSTTSHRYVSLLPATTDADENMVLTGIKFSKHQRIVVMEIQQGRTMPQGQVDPSSLMWVSLPPLSLDSPSFQADVHYHVLSYEARSIDLDQLKAPIGHVITGTRFRMLGPHLNLEIRVTPVDFESGQLRSNMSYWKSNDNTPVATVAPRQELHLYRPDDPARLASESHIDSMTNMFMQFQPSDMVADAAQMTVPYFDAQPLSTSPASWLTGLSLHHKGRSGNGGFLAFELESYNATRHFGEIEE